ncbi:hypothetical protein CR513_16534, partial [Mucuna pruriens]
MEGSCIRAGAISEATVLAESESRAAYSTNIWTNRGHAGTKIPGTRISPTIATINVTSTKFFLSGRLSETNLVDTVTQMQSIGSGSIPSDDSESERGEELAWCGYEAVENYHSQMSLSRVRDQLELRLNQEPIPESVPLSFPNRTVSARRFEIDEDLLKLFKKVEINIPLLGAIKQIPKYVRFLKGLCVYKRKTMKEAIETGGVVLALVQQEGANAELERILPKKCQDPGIFIVPCTIDDRTFTGAMMDLRASINVMPASIYQSLNLGI